MPETLLDLYNEAASHSVADNASAADASSTHNGDPDEPVIDASTNGMRLELIDLTARYRIGAQAPTVTQTGHRDRPRVVLHQYSEYALRIIREIMPNRIDGKTTLEVSSPIIQGVLRRVMSSYAFLNLAADPIVIKKPYAPLFHYREELKKVASESTNELERIHMKVFMDSFYQPYLGEVEKFYRDEIPNGRVRFEYLWTLFRAEDDVIVHTNHYREVQRVVHYDESRGDEDFFFLFTWRWGYNAGKFGPCSETVSIPKFSSTRRIQQLPCFPIKELDPAEAEKICRELVDRGMMWRRLIQPSHRLYNGPMWTGQYGIRNHSSLDIRHTRGHIILDHQLHAEAFGYLDDQLVGAQGYQMNGRGVPGQLMNSDYPARRIGSNGTVRYNSRASNGDRILFNQAECHNDDENYIMSEEEALLSPARTRGFSLLDKTWGFFLVENVKNVEFSPRAFNSLALDPYFKDTIQALIYAHNAKTTEFDDIIAGKGKGVIISLEGPPGSGKTLAAESMAEAAEKPLYAISTSELGTEANNAETRLKSIFRRAEKWNAIVLLDEADLFLTERTTGDLDRNALVTVFLRTIEYFQGIMFLTSNRVQHFDPAFESRIHLRVPFESPTPETRSRIWSTFLPDDCVKEEAAQRLGHDFQINGREIKNLIHISLLVAKFREEKFSESLVRNIYNHTKKGSLK